MKTKRQDAEAYLGRKLLSDLEEGRCNGNIIKTLTYVQQLFDQINCIPDIGEEAKSAACYAATNIHGAIDLCEEATEERRQKAGIS